MNLPDLSEGFESIGMKDLRSPVRRFKMPQSFCELSSSDQDIPWTTMDIDSRVKCYTFEKSVLESTLKHG